MFDRACYDGLTFRYTTSWEPAPGTKRIARRSSGANQMLTEKRVTR